MVVSSVAVRVAGMVLCALAAAVIIAGSACIVALNDDASLRGVTLLVPFLLALAFLLPGVFMCIQPSEVSERLFIRTLGLSRHDRKAASEYDLAEAIPFEHRKANPTVASAVYRVTLRARVDRTKVFSRIASTVLVGTDAAQLFGPRLDEFVYVFSQSVEQMDDRDADALLALVRKNMATPDDVITYLGELESVSATTWALHEGVPLEYVRALL